MLVKKHAIQLQRKHLCGMITLSSMSRFQLMFKNEEKKKSINTYKLYANLLVSTKNIEEIWKPSIRIAHYVQQRKHYRNH